jgi:hypothetical protein
VRAAGHLVQHLHRDARARLAAGGRRPPHDICPWCDLSVPRAGSTSLHNYLALHPDIAMSADKEVRFVTDPDHLSWVGRYQELIPSSHQL